MSSSIFTRAADVAQRAAVLGLLSGAGFQLYQIGSKTLEGKIDSPYLHSTYHKGVCIVP
jgi:hypothetical protein